MASEKITALIEEVKALTVLELSELVHALEDEFGVSAAAPVAVAAAAAPAAATTTPTPTATESATTVPPPRRPLLPGARAMPGTTQSTPGTAIRPATIGEGTTAAEPSPEERGHHAE